MVKGEGRNSMCHSELSRAGRLKTYGCPSSGAEEAGKHKLSKGEVFDPGFHVDLSV